MTATLSLTQLLEIWRDVAMGRLGDDRGAVHLKAGEWDALHAAFAEHGADPSPQAIFDYGKDDDEVAGVPSLATDWPAHNNYKVELDATSQLYDSLVTLLRSSWRDAVQRRPPELGLLASASGLAKLWRQEKEGHGALAFERCRSRLNKTVQDWQEKLVRPRAKAKPCRRTPKAVAVLHDYAIVDDQWEGRVTAHFEDLELSSGDVAYDGNDRTLHDLMVQIRRNEEEFLTYDMAARAFGLRDVPSRMRPEHRVRPVPRSGKPSGVSARNGRKPWPNCSSGCRRRGHRSPIRSGSSTKGRRSKASAGGCGGSPWTSRPGDRAARLEGVPIMGDAFP